MFEVYTSPDDFGHWLATNSDFRVDTKSPMGFESTES